MIYNLKYNNLLSSTDGSIENIQDPFDKYDIINYYYILIVIVPCASAIDRLAELREMRNNYMKSRDCGNCEKVCCDCCLN